MCKQCDDRIAEHAAEVARFEAAYPDYCRTCGGSGVHEYNFDPSPVGVSLAPGSMTENEPCPDCTEKGKCSLCGKPLGENDQRLCECESEALPILEYKCPEQIAKERALFENWTVRDPYGLMRRQCNV